MSLNRKFIASQATESGIDDAGITAIMNAHNAVVQSLKDDLEKERAETARVQAELAAAKNPNDGEVQRLQTELEAEKNAHEIVKAAHAATKETLEKALSDEKAAHVATKSDHEKERINAAKDKAISTALKAAGYSEAAIPLFLKAGYDREQLTQEADGSIAGMDKLVESVKADTLHSAFFGMVQTVGADVGTPPPASGSGEKNPWLKESLSLAEQTRIFRENPARARELAKAAGITL
jgi:hypothetical protein